MSEDDVLAIKQGDRKTIAARIANDPSWVMSRFDDQDQPLHVACWYGQCAIVVLLLESGAEPDARGYHGRTALHGAVDQGHVDVVMILLKAGANVNAKDAIGLTPLQMIGGTTRRHEFHLLGILLGNGADIDARTAVVFNRPDWLRWIARDNPAEIVREGKNLLYAAILQGEVPLVKCVLESGVSASEIPPDMSPPLMIALKEPVNLSMLETLLTYGADVTTTDPYTNETPLERAARLDDRRAWLLLSQYVHK